MTVDERALEEAVRAAFATTADVTHGEFDKLGPAPQALWRVMFRAAILAYEAAKPPQPEPAPEWDGQGTAPWDKICKRTGKPLPEPEPEPAAVQRSGVDAVSMKALAKKLRETPTGEYRPARPSRGQTGDYWVSNERGMYKAIQEAAEMLETIASLSPAPTSGRLDPAKFAIARDWFNKKAEQEGDMEVGAGTTPTAGDVREAARLDAMFDRFLDRYAAHDGYVSADDLADYLGNVRDAVRAALSAPASAPGSGVAKLVILESPYAGDVDRNVAYARACLRDSLQRGEAPLASHLLYTQPGVLDDAKPDERAHGINAGLEWGARADLTAVYTDLGVSRGMEYGIANALASDRPVERRQLGGVWS